MLPKPMARSYGKIPRGGRGDQPALPVEIQINITGRHTIEQLSMELQKAISRLLDHKVYGVQKVRMRLQPLDEKGSAVALWSEGGKPIETISIPDLPEEPPYRPE